MSTRELPSSRYHHLRLVETVVRERETSKPRSGSEPEAASIRFLLLTVGIIWSVIIALIVGAANT